MSKFWTFFLDKFRISSLLIIFIFVVGTFAYKVLPRENAPDIEIPVGIITTAWPGANATDVEISITNKIEKEIKNVENLKSLNSTSQNGISMITAEFEVGTDLTKNFQNLRDALEKADKLLPRDLPASPTVIEASLSDAPIVSFAVAGDYSWTELRRFTDILDKSFSEITGVKEVNINGVSDPKIHVFIDPEKLEFHGLSVSEVTNMIRAQHKNMPLGDVFVGGQKIEVRLDGEFKDVNDLENLNIKPGLKLGDISEIKREFGQMDVRTFFHDGETLGSAILIDVVKKGGKTDVIQTINKVFDNLENLRNKNLIPDNLIIKTTYNSADDINESLNILINSGAITLLIILVTLFIFLGLRESLVSAIAIPMSILLTMIFLYLTGKTFNFISLFALVIAIGLVVDNAIILAEGISENIFEKKMSPREAAFHAIKTFRAPVIAGTLTTIFAFLPMLFFISGVNGEFISHLPITVITVLIASLLVSLFLLPVVGVKFFQYFPVKQKDHDKEAHFVKKGIKNLQAFYADKMSFILEKTWRSFAIMGLAVLALGSAFFLVISSLVGFEIFPAADQNYFTVKVELPVGTKLSDTEKYVKPMAKKLEPYFTTENETGEVILKNLVFSVGKESSAMTGRVGGGNFSKENILGITVNLIDKHARKTESLELVNKIKKDIESVLPTFSDVEIAEIQEGPPSGAAIDIQITGEDFVEMERVANALKNELTKLDGLKNVTDNIPEKTTQFSWEFDADLLAKFGLTTSSVSETLRAALHGVTVFQIFEGDETIDIDLRLDFAGESEWDDLENLEIISQIPIKTPSGKFIRLEQVAKGEFGAQVSQITHLDTKRIIFVKSDLADKTPVSQVTPNIEKIIEKVKTDLNLRDTINIKLGGDDEDSMRLVMEMMQSMIFALFLILIALILQFDSFSRAFSILMLVPFSLTGVFWGFFLIGQSISFPTMIGIVALAGIIVNDAIVLIDRINQNHLKLEDKHKAMVTAGVERLQPILLTSLTTVFGLLPMVWTDPTWGALGLAIVFGMIFSTVLTLLLVPCMLVMFDATAGFFTGRKESEVK